MPRATPKIGTKSTVGLVAAEPRSLGKTAALEQLSTDEQAVAFEPSPLSQPLQSLCPEAPASDAIAIWTPISPASMADRLMPRARKTPWRSAKIRRDGQSFIPSMWQQCRPTARRTEISDRKSTRL